MSVLPRPRADEIPAPHASPQGDRAATRVLLVGPDRLFAETLRSALRQVGMDVKIASPPELEGAWAVLPPDLVVVEVGIPGPGLETAKRLLAMDPSVKVVALLQSLTPRELQAVSEVGFSGYLTKDTPLSTFVHGLRHCLAGRSFRLRPRPPRRRPPADLLGDQLTPREREVVAILVEGSGNGEIGVRLQISPNTVRTHIQSVLTKLQLHSRVEIAAWAYRNGLGSGSVW